MIFNEKIAASTADAAGKVLATIMKHPLLTAGAVGTVMVAPWITDKAYKMTMLRGQLNENKNLNENEALLKSIADNTKKQEQRKMLISNLS